MLTAIEKDEGGVINAIKFIAETPDEQKHLAEMKDGFLSMTSEKKEQAEGQ